MRRKNICPYNEEGNADGLWVYYYRRINQISDYVWFTNGERNGLSITYETTSEIQCIGFYKKGESVGFHRRYDI